MANNTLLKKILASSPYVEILVRHLYWHNITLINKLKLSLERQNKQKKEGLQTSSFPKIISFLSNNGVEKGCLLVVHSAYRPLLSTGKPPDQIIQCLLDLLGPNGTLAMPAMPKFVNDVSASEYLWRDISKITFQYDTKDSPITTGILPKILCNFQGAIRSRYPINTMVALGPLAAPMMKKNLEGLSPLPCGINSSWNYCHENDAVVVALGVDLSHTLTMIHVAEDLLDEKWPIENWYRNRHFEITDGDFRTEVTLRERHPRWGTLHYAERTLCKDLINERIMRTAIIDGITVECLRAKDLICYLNARNYSGYPYYGVGKYAKKSSS